jgi:recombination associated protein RdgC
MLPRNLTLFRFSATVAHDLVGRGIGHLLADRPAREPGPLEMGASGFASPYAIGDDRMTVVSNGCVGFVFQMSDRLLPGSVVNEAVAKKVQKIVDEEGRKVGGRERKRIRDEVLTDMLPNAPVKVRRIRGWLDTVDGWLVLDTPSRRNAESTLIALREAFGSFPAVPLAPEEGPRVLMTDWLANDNIPTGITLGDECELRDMASRDGAVMRCRNQDLDAEEVKEHLRSGKQVLQLGVVYDERMSLVLTESLAIKRLKPFDVVSDTREESESHDAQVDCDLALATLEVRRLLGFLEESFKLPRPAEA